MRRPRPSLLLVGAGMAALAFLLVMIGSGRPRPMQSLVAFEAAGLMREAPDQIDRVDLEASGQRWTFARREGGWRLTTSPEKLMAGTASHLEASLKFMHVTAPVRVMSRDEYQPAGLGEYGLDPPRYTVSLQRGGQTVLATSFGGKNPQQVFQYVRVAGRDGPHPLPKLTRELHHGGAVVELLAGGAEAQR